MKESEFRILGAELNETDSHIDIAVDGIDADGGVSFSEVNGSRSWSIEHRELQRLMRENYMVGASEVADHQLWKDANNLNGRRGSANQEFVNEELVKAQRALFLAAYFETR